MRILRGDVMETGEPTFPGPREIRFLLEMTLIYSRALQDTITVFEETMTEHPQLALTYARLVDYLRSLVSRGEGGLVAVAQECGRLLGLEEERK